MASSSAGYQSGWARAARLLDAWQTREGRNYFRELAEQFHAQGIYECERKCHFEHPDEIWVCHHFGRDDYISKTRRSGIPEPDEERDSRLFMCSLHYECYQATKRTSGANTWLTLAWLLNPMTWIRLFFRVSMPLASIAATIGAMFLLVALIPSALGEQFIDFVAKTPLGLPDGGGERDIIPRGILLFLIIGVPVYVPALALWFRRRKQRATLGDNHWWRMSLITYTLAVLAFCTALFCYLTVSSTVPVPSWLEQEQVQSQRPFSFTSLMALTVSLVWMATRSTISRLRIEA